MIVDYETTVGTIVLENIVIRKGKEHSHNEVSYNYLGSPIFTRILYFVWLF